MHDRKGWKILSKYLDNWHCRIFSYIYTVYTLEMIVRMLTGLSFFMSKGEDFLYNGVIWTIFDLPGNTLVLVELHCIYETSLKFLQWQQEWKATAKKENGGKTKLDDSKNFRSAVRAQEIYLPNLQNSNHEMKFLLTLLPFAVNDVNIMGIVLSLNQSGLL